MIGVKPNETVLIRDDLFLVENSEKCTYTLYRTVETIANLTMQNEEGYKGKPYYYDLETKLFRVLEKVGEAPNNDLGLDSLLSTVPSL